MKLRKLLKPSYILCMILFYITAVFGSIIVIDHAFHLWFPDHPVTVFLGSFEPVFPYVNLYFYENLELYSSTSFLILYLLSSISLMGWGVFFLWYISRLLKNIDKKGLFKKVNVSILYKVGIVTLILVTIYSNIDSYLLKQAIQELEIVNADLVLADFPYFDGLFSSVGFFIFAFALNKAILAIEGKEQ